MEPEAEGLADLALAATIAEDRTRAAVQGQGAGRMVETAVMGLVAGTEVIHEVPQGLAPETGIN